MLRLRGDGHGGLRMKGRLMKAAHWSANLPDSRDVGVCASFWHKSVPDPDEFLLPVRKAPIPNPL